ncbi:MULTISPECIES: hypothetical protein [unclassified Moorena]|nr:MULTISPECIES: hypothetical protein [unclassified Moorena]NEO22051.1 hypothetical protein [Moorena sp. SIO4A5]NEP24482.1 hypothetical protein [Moorena sp. SIO3I6]NEQ56853.1 hypothetical protein [Moorena sp. SIO4A1]
MQQRRVKGEDPYQTLVWPFGLSATLRERPRYANALPLETKTVAQRWKP